MATAFRLAPQSASVSGTDRLHLFVAHRCLSFADAIFFLFAGNCVDTCTPGDERNMIKQCGEVESYPGSWSPWCTSGLEARHCQRAKCQKPHAFLLTLLAICKTCGSTERVRERNCSIGCSSEDCPVSVEVQRDASPCKVRIGEGGKRKPFSFDFGDPLTCVSFYLLPTLQRAAFTPWTTWSQCSTDCGEGSSLRHRVCEGTCFDDEAQCGEGVNETETSVCVAGDAATWTQWAAQRCESDVRPWIRKCLANCHGACQGEEVDNRACAQKTLQLWAGPLTPRADAPLTRVLVDTVVAVRLLNALRLKVRGNASDTLDSLIAARPEPGRRRTARLRRSSLFVDDDLITGKDPVTGSMWVKLSLILLDTTADSAVAAVGAGVSAEMTAATDSVGTNVTLASSRPNSASSTSGGSSSSSSAVAGGAGAGAVLLIVLVVAVRARRQRRSKLHPPPPMNRMALGDGLDGTGTMPDQQYWLMGNPAYTPGWQPGQEEANAKAVERPTYSALSNSDTDREVQLLPSATASMTYSQLDRKEGTYSALSASDTDREVQLLPSATAAMTYSQLDRKESGGVYSTLSAHDAPTPAPAAYAVLQATSTSHSDAAQLAQQYDFPKSDAKPIRSAYELPAVGNQDTRYDNSRA